jgi:ATP-dependent 26S proteasome regulatory subunit
LQLQLGFPIHPLTLGEFVVRPSFIMSDPERDQSLEDYKKCLLELREWETKLKTLRLGIKDLQREFDISEENIKALQSVGQIIGEVLKQLDEERCEYHPHYHSSRTYFG